MMTAAKKDRVAGQEFLSLFLKLDEDDRVEITNNIRFKLSQEKYRASRSVTGRAENVIHVDFRK